MRGAWRTARWVLAALGCVSPLGCSAESKLRTEGPTPYVRCVAGPEPDARTLRAGPWTFEVRERVLEVRGPTRALRLAVLSAPGFGDAPGASALARLREANADLLILLGGVGDGVEAASMTLRTLASLPVPSLVVLGGRDTWIAHEKALEGLAQGARIMDGTVLRAIRIGSNTIIPLPGAEKGRYALHASACGFDQSDLDAVAEYLGAAAPGEARWLLSWQAPSRLAGMLGPRSAFGTILGSALVARFANKVGAKGGLYAWPIDETAVVSAGPLGLAAVPRLFGPRLETSTGARLAHAILVLEVGADGVRVAL